MRFKSKWDLLEHLGKDRKYVRYVDKLMLKEIVYMVDWEYEYNDPYDEEIQWYVDKIHTLEQTIKDKDKQLKDKEELILWQNSYIKELENSESSWSDNTDEVIEAVYKYFTQVRRMMIEHDDFVEWVKKVL